MLSPIYLFLERTCRKMSNVVEFPNKENDVRNEIVKQNENFIASIREKMKNEYDALLRTQNETAIQMGRSVQFIVNSVIAVLSKTFIESPEMNEKISAPYFMNHCMQSVNAILAGGVISPITGCDEEWVDTTVPEDVGQEFKCTYRGREYSVKIESVQVNKRYPKIFRLNNDNNLAHRIDFFQFHDATNPEHIHLTEDSIRFIKFPYSMQSAHSQCILEDNKISDYLDFDYDEIVNGLVYIDQTNDDPNSYIVAPKIPFNALEGFGIDVEDEVSEYLKIMSGTDGDLSVFDEDDNYPDYDDDFDDDDEDNMDLNAFGSPLPNEDFDEDEGSTLYDTVGNPLPNVNIDEE